MTRTFQTTAWLAAVGTMMIGGAALGAKAKKAAEAKEPPKAIERAPWGEADGKPVELFTLTNKNGLVVKVTNYGAHVIEVHTPDKHGKMADITEGYGTLDEYVNGKTQYQGATVGRNGNRIANAKFELGGKTYKLAANNGPHNLHGGVKGWNKAVWAAEPYETPDGPAVKFSLVSKDGDEGFPGTVHATTTYTLTNDNELKVEMTATTDKPTVVNMVHHTYWNLHGGTKGDIKDHILQIFADKFTPGLPPEGEVKDVAGTPFDFTKPKAIGKDLKAAGSPGHGCAHRLRRELGRERRSQGPAPGRQGQGSQVRPRDGGVRESAGRAVLRRDLHGRLDQGEGPHARPVLGVLPRGAGVPERDQRPRLA